MAVPQNLSGIGFPALANTYVCQLIQTISRILCLLFVFRVFF